MRIVKFYNALLGIVLFCGCITCFAMLYCIYLGFKGEGWIWVIYTIILGVIIGMISDKLKEKIKKLNSVSDDSTSQSFNSVHEPPDWLRQAIIENIRYNYTNSPDRGSSFIQAVKDGFLEHGEWGEDLKQKSSGTKLKDNKGDWDLFKKKSWELVEKGKEKTDKYRMVPGMLPGMKNFAISAKGVTDILTRCNLERLYIYAPQKEQ